METGFVKLSRQMLNWEWFSDSHTTHVFIYCLLKANYKDKEWQGRTIKRGNFVTSVKTISKDTGLTVRQVRTALDHLVMTKEITKHSTNWHTIITVLNYEKYQKIETQPTSKTTSKTTNRKTSKKSVFMRDSEDEKVESDKPNDKPNDKQPTNKPTNKTTNLKILKKPVNISVSSAEKNKTTNKTTSKTTTTKNIKKDYNYSLRNNYNPPASPRALRAPGVSVEEFLVFTRTIPGGNDNTADWFYGGFRDGHTQFPEEWRELYAAFAKSPEDKQDEFVKRLRSGAFRERWGGDL